MANVVNETAEKETTLQKIRVNDQNKLNALAKYYGPGENRVTLLTHLLELTDVLIAVNQPDETLSETLQRLIQTGPAPDFEGLCLQKEGETDFEYFSRLRKYRDYLHTNPLGACLDDGILELLKPT